MFENIFLSNKKNVLCLKRLQKIVKTGLKRSMNFCAKIVRDTWSERGRKIYRTFLFLTIRLTRSPRADRNKGGKVLSFQAARGEPGRLFVRALGTPGAYRGTVPLEIPDPSLCLSRLPDFVQCYLRISRPLLMSLFFSSTLWPTFFTNYVS